MAEKTNKEGLTFEEWVCAAGVAVFCDDRVRPYTSSYTSYKSVALQRPKHLPNVVTLVFGTSRRAGPVKAVKNTTVFYSKKIRQAFLAGEDPTEWRA
jgi:hypothetical protein